MDDFHQNGEVMAPPVILLLLLTKLYITRDKNPTEIETIMGPKAEQFLMK